MPQRVDAAASHVFVNPEKPVLFRSFVPPIAARSGRLDALTQRVSFSAVPVGRQPPAYPPIGRRGASEIRRPREVSPMAEQTSFVREGIDRVSSAFERIPDELQRVQREIQKRRKSLERQLAGSRKDLGKRTREIEKRTRRQVERLRTEIRRMPLARRVERLRTETERVLERSVDAVLGVLQIASKSDLDRIDKKLGQMSRRLKEMERGRGNGHAASA